VDGTTADLFEYGIQTEHSDIRAHVSVVNKVIYVFPTQNGLAAIVEHEHEAPLVDAGQEGVIGRTACGWLIKPEWIADMRRLPYGSWPRWAEFDNKKLTTTQKGALAVDCVLQTMRIGRFPFWLNATEDERQNVQLDGTDILVFCKKKVQVKCDAKCGERPLGTGNLFLQKAERNPLKRH
jgi:hypothetical protein